MGTQQFQMEYIEYLQNRNNDLVNKLNDMKASYEKKMLSKDLNRQYLVSLMEDTLNVCSSLPEEIDIFFEKMSIAMDALKAVLVKKSEIVQLVDKMSHVMQTIGLIAGEKNFPSNLPGDLRNERRSGMVKVSPMINGHVILTEPRICLNRISKKMYPRRSEAQPLSPILEMSPGNSDFSLTETPIKTEPIVRIEGLDLNATNIRNEKQDSLTPNQEKKSDKKKKSPSSKQMTKSPLMNSANKKTEETLNNEDPLEGPSWLYNDREFLGCYVNFRRPRHRFADVFDRTSKLSGKKTSGASRVSLKEGEPAKVTPHKGKKNSPGRRTDKHSYESFIEETPPKTVNLKTKTKKEIIDELSLKEPRITLEDCMPKLKTKSGVLEISEKLDASPVITAESNLDNSKEEKEETKCDKENFLTSNDELSGHDCRSEKSCSFEDETGRNKVQEAQSGANSKRLFNPYFTLHNESVEKELENGSGDADENFDFCNLNAKYREWNDFENRIDGENVSDEKFDQFSEFYPEMPLVVCIEETSKRTKTKKKVPSLINYSSDSSSQDQTTESLSRKKRKAAPENLREPDLVSKLRRD